MEKGSGYMKQNSRVSDNIILLFASILLFFLPFLLLHNDSGVFWVWWLAALVMGIITMPISAAVFRNFDDKGWIFSKVLGIAIAGFAEWYLVSCKIIRFSRLSCYSVCAVLALMAGLLLRKQMKEKTVVFPSEHIKLIIIEEMLFFAAFLLWTYMAGFNPNSYGTETFMDYGFMEAMMRSETLPAVDMWYSKGHINYYYGGQYFAVFMTKITGSSVENAYNLMRTFVAGLAYILPCSLVIQMVRDLTRRRKNRSFDLVSIVAGMITGTAVSIAGNVHYIIFAWIYPAIQKIAGVEEISSYWFPDATRYIGYNPPRPLDETIHEFPCYSFVLGDLHAHVVNIMFVCLMIGTLYAWMAQERTKKKPEIDGVRFWLKEFLHPNIFIGACLLGMFQLTNYWDFVIYFVVMGGTVLFTNLVRFKGRLLRVLMATVVHTVEMAVVSIIASLPFNLQFKTMQQGVGIAQNHSMFYQLVILWGLPVCASILMISQIVYNSIKERKTAVVEIDEQAKLTGIYRFFERISTPDLFAIITSLCAIGLVCIPEFLYVRDIYEATNARANTMFKLTYQAYIMFGISIGYGLMRVIICAEKKFMVALSVILLSIWACTLGYFHNAGHAWFGEYTDPTQYKHLNSLGFLENDFPEDVGGINWLKENVKDVKVVLEANGDSYTNYNRVSAATGLPTILGWYVHQWLWRNDTEDLNAKSRDVETIYTSESKEDVMKLLVEYDVSYIFVGSMEKEKYGDSLNTELLRSLGPVVYEDQNSGTFIVQFR